MHSNVAVCWRNRSPEKMLPKFQSLHKEIMSMAAGTMIGGDRDEGVHGQASKADAIGHRIVVTSPAAKVLGNVDRDGLPITWFQMCRISRYAPWGLQIACDRCAAHATEPAEGLDSTSGTGNMSIQPPQSVLAISEKNRRGSSEFSIFCPTCARSAVLKKPKNFRIVESGASAMMAFPQPEMQLNWRQSRTTVTAHLGRKRSRSLMEEQ